MNFKTTKHEKKKLIEDRTMQILRFLNLRVKNSNIVEQLGIVLRLYKYVVQNIYEDSYEESETQKTKQEEYLNDLYKGVLKNPGDQTTNAILLNHLLYMKGFDTHIILAKSKKGVPHVANIARIGKEYFFFDTTLERSIYVEQGENPDEMLFCCAALGKEEYSKFYTPIEVLNEDLDKPAVPFPTAMAEESMPRQLIESVVKLIPDLSIENNPEFERCASQDEPSVTNMLPFMKRNKRKSDDKDREREE